MTRTQDILRQGRTSHARSIDTLVREVKDLVVQVWHSPQALHTLKSHANARTKLELAMDPSLLKHLKAGEASSHIHDLCRWMQDHSVEYSVGYTPLLSHQSDKSRGHVLAVAVFISQR